VHFGLKAINSSPQREVWPTSWPANRETIFEFIVADDDDFARRLLPISFRR
jgi:hypothetical protein